MKKFLVIFLLTLLCIACACVVQKEKVGPLYDLQNSVTQMAKDDSLSIIPVLPTEEGNAEAGYKYLVAGNAFSSGIPVEMYRFFQQSKLAQLVGNSKFAMNEFVIFKNDEGRLIATPGCLHCHAQQFNNEYIIGLGNSYTNFQANNSLYLKLLEEAIRIRYGKRSTEWKSAERVFEAARVLASAARTQVQGPTPAHKIAELMASHRDPMTLVFRDDTTYFPVPSIVFPEDPPALWISKKRKALDVNARRQGNFLKHITSNSLLTLKDSTEARKINNHAKDVWAYIKTLEAPAYPLPIDETLAGKGKKIFLRSCSRCHGTYDGEGEYPNALVPGNIIGTDSLMWKYFIKYPEYTDWYNKSWFAVSAPISYIKPQAGYVPPPLDGVWITAPYLHNGSLPTLEMVLNSRIRPRYWERNFNKEEYDYKTPGWKFKVLSKPTGKKTYNTDIPGYGNYGHTFGDHLTGEQRKALIEYLKTL